MPALAVVQLAIARAKIALHAAVIERVPPLRGVKQLGAHRSLHLSTV
jgi:hypothetical protein